MTNNPTIDGVSRELLPCPLCGSEDISLAWDVYDTDRGRRTQSQIRCLGCRVLTKTFNSHADARSYWNNRAAPQSTIARLEARIAELDSGRGEPAAWANGEQLKLCAASPREVQPNNPMMHNLPRNIAGSALPTEYCNTPLFSAPPAPVAVVLPELESAFENWWEEDGQYCRAGGGSYEKTFAYRAYEAAIDATAALNGVKS